MAHNPANRPHRRVHRLYRANRHVHRLYRGLPRGHGTTYFQVINVELDNKLSHRVLCWVTALFMDRRGRLDTTKDIFLVILFSTREVCNKKPCGGYHSVIMHYLFHYRRQVVMGNGEGWGELFQVNQGFCFRKPGKISIGALFGYFPRKEGTGGHTTKKKSHTQRKSQCSNVNPHPLLPPNLIMEPKVLTLSSPEIMRSFPVQSLHDRSKGPWNHVYWGLAPGSKPNNMAAVMRVNVSPEIDQQYEFLRGKAAVDLENKYLYSSDINIDWRHGERAGACLENTRVRPSCIKWPLTIFGCDSCWEKDTWWTLWYFKMRWVVLITHLWQLLPLLPSLRILPLDFALKIEPSGLRSWFRSCVRLNQSSRAYHEAITVENPAI